ncbi:MAG: hypothetical protein LC731_06330 [Acidobacteria bacterium]|nr:hypothetical protein [Acidobacteriota bacterium]
MSNTYTCRFLRLTILLYMCLCAWAMTTTGSASVPPSISLQDGEQGARQGRMSPPSGLSCDRNHTTSFTGRITGYSRTTQRIFIRVRTDEQTTEQFTIRLGRRENAAKKFLFQGEAFKAGDWKKVESSRGILRPKMRATIWACRDDNDDFKAELIDWRPDENEGSYVL